MLRVRDDPARRRALRVATVAEDGRDIAASGAGAAIAASSHYDQARLPRLPRVRSMEPRIPMVELGHAAADHDVVFGHALIVHSTPTLNITRAVAGAEDAVSVERGFHIRDASLLLRRSSLGRARCQSRRSSAENDGDAKSSIHFGGHCRISLCPPLWLVETRAECSAVRYPIAVCVSGDLNRQFIEGIVRLS